MRAPKRARDDAVDRLGVADAGVDQGERLAPERVLQPVADEAGDVAADVHRRLAERREGGHRLLDDGGPRGRRLDDLDERHDVRRVPEVRADDAPGSATASAIAPIEITLSVAREDRVGPRQLVERAKSPA